jgi:hypothetical protein
VDGNDIPADAVAKRGKEKNTEREKRIEEWRV